MTGKGEVEILLVEDDPKDARLTLHALQKENLRNRMEVVSDGEQALDFIFSQAACSGRSPRHPPDTRRLRRAVGSGVPRAVPRPRCRFSIIATLSAVVRDYRNSS